MQVNPCPNPKPEPKPEYPLDYVYIASHEGMYIPETDPNSRIIVLISFAMVAKIWFNPTTHTLVPLSPSGWDKVKFRTANESLCMDVVPL